jgi:hypothetical protein
VFGCAALRGRLWLRLGVLRTCRARCYNVRRLGLQAVIIMRYYFLACICTVTSTIAIAALLSYWSQELL